MRRERILVVEDDAVARLDIQAALERIGCTVAGYAVSGEEAIQQAASLDPDLVLMDIRLEGRMDGVEAANEISARYGIPIIYLTVYADDDTLRWAKVSGPYGYLLKPVDHKELKTAIEIGLYRHQMETQLRKAKAEAETASRAKTSFLATVSHELRTPMNGVLGMTELLLLSDLGDPYRENVQLIKDSAMSLLSVLNQIIDYSKLEASSLKLRELDFRLEDLVTGILSQYNQDATGKGVRLEYSMDSAIPAWLKGDSGKIRQILGNLMNNAVKYTQSGQVLVDITRMDVAETVSDDDIMVQIMVQDTGVGMPQDKVGLMFDCFTQAEDYLSHATGGLGLGLAIVARLVSLLGGSIQCSSEEGRGSTFAFRLPLRRSRYAVSVPSVAALAERQPLVGVRILVAEDDLVNQRYITRLLGKLGGEVTLVDDGLRAIDALKADHFDVVLMDVEMPVLNGLEATRVIRDPQSECLDPAIPIIALTAHAMWGDEQRCLHAGMDDYVPKPVDVDTVTAIIQSILEN